MTEMKQENARLHQENLLLHLMSQDVFEKVTEKLEMQRSGLRQEFDDKFNVDGFRQAYHEYVQEHHQYHGLPCAQPAPPYAPCPPTVDNFHHHDG